MKDKVKRVINFLLFICFLLLIVSFFMKRNISGKEGIVGDLFQEPIQKETDEKDFYFGYRGKRYNVLPVADYELWGLVVSHNDINKWYNFYHDENSVNLKDICVVWGDNFIDNNHQKMNYKSGEWTCYITSKNNIDYASSNRFKINKLSNNHLLSDNEEVLKIIRKINIGDQVHFSGLLVDYAQQGSTWYRQTSISREDQNSNSRSGGACEIFFVRTAEILKKGNRNWHLLFNTLKYFFLFLIFVKIVILFNEAKNLKTHLVRVDD